jgi:hypothetical protein
MRECPHRARSKSIALLICLLISFPSWSATNEAQQNEDLQEEINTLKTTVQKLETHIIKGEKQARNKLRPLGEKIREQQRALKVSGFASYGLTKSTRNIELADVLFRDEFYYRSDSVMGLQLDYMFDEHFTSTLQMVAKGYDEFDVEAEWVYLTYRFNEHWSAVGGRFRQPLFIYSDLLEVGVAYPWVRPPWPFYYTAASATEGFKATYQITMGAFHHEASLIVSSSINKILGLEVTTDDMYFFNYRGSFKNSDFYYTRAEASLSAAITPALVLEDKVIMNNAGIRYEGNKWFVNAEYQNALGKDLILVSEITNYYLSPGYQLTEQWRIHATYGKLRTNEAALQGVVQARRRAIGLRYDVTPNVAIKLEAERSDRFGATVNPDSELPLVPFKMYTLVIDSAF